MTNQSFAHKLEYDFGYAAGKVDALDTNMGAKYDPRICGEPTYFVRQQTAICESGYAHAYNYFCLILPYSTSAAKSPVPTKRKTMKKRRII